MVKSKEKETLIDDLKETFDNLRVYKMMLNLAKCVFGVPAGKLLGFLVSNRGIEANSKKIKAITSLAKSACINDVQRLVGRIAALSRFISRLGEKVIPLYQMMKKILHTTLISGLGTLEPKGHRNIAEGSKGSDEGSLLLVLNCPFDLMIT